MEKEANHRQLIAELPILVNELNNWDKYEIFEESLKNHELFRGPMNSISNLEKYGRIVSVLLYLSRKRATCKEIIQLLRQFGQQLVATKLEQLNSSPGVMEFTFNIYLDVAKTDFPFKDMSGIYPMTETPRGICVIINNVEDRQSPQSMKGLRLETQRFDWIFTKLHFQVLDLTALKLSAEQMVTELTKIKNEGIQEKDQAFVLMVVSHGENDRVFGYKACDAMRRVNFGEIELDSDVEQEIQRDQLDIKTIVQLFSTNYTKLVSKPKLFFFTCCRSITSSDVPQNRYERSDITPNTMGVSQLDNFVCYSVQKGFESEYNDFDGITDFGQAFSHSIAQYACEESLSQIMSRTDTALRTMCSEPNGSFATELKLYSMSKQIYFNPGH